MTDNLKPCPFCGGEGELERTLDRFDYAINSGPDTVKEYGWYVYCTKCDAGTYVINVPPSSPEEAIAAWNRRAGSWQPLRADDPYLDDSPVWLDENGCVCWAGAGGETQRLVLYGDMQLCLWVDKEEAT